MSQISTDLTNVSPEILQYLSMTPAIPPPAGVTPNFVDPYSRKNTQIITTSVILGLMVMFYFNRMYTKLWLMKKVTWDDATITIAFLASLAYYIGCTWGAEKGRIGTHLWNISILQAASMDLLAPSYIISVLTPFTFLFMKGSFFILYLTLFDSAKSIRIASYIGLVFSSVTYITFTIMVFYWATPKKGESWLAHQTSASMHNELKLSVPQSVLGLVIDLYILVVPIIGVYGLRMSTKRKVGVLLIFLSGLMAVICSICSIYYRVILDRVADSTWHLIPVNIATLSEMFVGVICACMPSAAYAARQQNSIQSKIIRTLSIRFDSLKSTLFGSKYGSKYASSSNNPSQVQKSESHPEPDVLKSTDRKYARYFSLNNMTTDSQDEKTNMTATANLPAAPSPTLLRNQYNERFAGHNMV